MLERKRPGYAGTTMNKNPGGRGKRSARVGGDRHSDTRQELEAKGAGGMEGTYCTLWEPVMMGTSVLGMRSLVAGGVMVQGGFVFPEGAASPLLGSAPPCLSLAPSLSPEVQMATFAG